MTNKFEIEIINYNHRNELVAEVYYKSEQWVEIFQKKGSLIAQFFAPTKYKYWEFSFDEALEVLEKAKDDLFKREYISKLDVSSGLINDQAQKVLEEILNDSKKKTYQQADGSFKIYASNGMGAFFKKDESFNGFIEKKYIKNNFSIELYSDLDFEGMVVNVCNHEETIATVNYDKGIENIEIEISPFFYKKSKNMFLIEDYILALEKAKKLALNCAQEDNLRNIDNSF